ncbi:MAG TPA: hypothetical protein VGZ47_11265, partial [Gemmataceae bacterium]|nr:hypothetical protein [Gemmataceae bacterium]
MRNPVAKPGQYSRAANEKTALFRISPIIFAIFALAGCDEASPPDMPEVKPVQIGAKFKRAETGTIAGRVIWSGTLPHFAPMSGAIPLPDGKTETRTLPNPNAPRINPQTGAVAGAVVYLEEVDPERSRPWDYPAVTVEMHAEAIRILQGEKCSSVGFVRHGEQIEMVSRDPVLHSLCARGAAFFTLAFPDANRPLRRRLEQPGV